MHREIVCHVVYWRLGESNPRDTHFDAWDNVSFLNFASSGPSSIEHHQVYADPVHTFYLYICSTSVKGVVAM